MKMAGLRKKNHNDYERMTGTPIPKLILSLCAATVLSNLISSVYNMADTYFVSQIDTSASAAVGAVYPIQAVIQAVGYGMGMGSGCLLSKALGAKEKEKASRYAASALLFTALFGLLFGIGCQFILSPLMVFLGSTETMLPYAVSYARFILFGAPMMMVSYILSTTLRWQGKAFHAMIGLCTGGILNLLLDPILMFTCGMGVGGAAFATFLSQLISFLILLVFYLCGCSSVSISPKNASRSPKTYGQIILAGIPTFFRQGLGSLSSALLTRETKAIAMLLSGDLAYVDASVAAISIANKVYTFCRNIVLGVGQAFQPVAGFNYGAKKYKRVKAAFLFATLIGTVFCVLNAAAIFLFSGQIMTFFRADDAIVIEIGSRALVFLAAILPTLAFSTFVNQLYQSLGFALPATILACCRQGIFYIPLIFLLPKYLGIDGISATQPLSDLLTALVSLPFLLWFFRKILSEEKEKVPALSKEE